MAFRPDDEGLTRAYVSFESAGEQAGLALSTGGFGPRIELDVETGDVVRLGRAFGTRRLGGWCDLYLPASLNILVWPGQTLIGGETVIGRLRAGFEDDLVIEVPEIVPPESPVPEPKPATVAAAPAVAEVAAAEEDFFDDYPEPDDVVAAEDHAAIFARLREAFRRNGESD
jgi:phosphatidylserine decarboxylase